MRSIIKILDYLNKHVNTIYRIVYWLLVIAVWCQIFAIYNLRQDYDRTVSDLKYKCELREKSLEALAMIMDRCFLHRDWFKTNNFTNANQIVHGLIRDGIIKAK